MIFNYNNLTWPNRKIDKSIQSGYYFAKLNQFMTINETLIGNVKTFSTGSNCNVKGKYIYRVNHTEMTTTTTTTTTTSIIKSDCKLTILIINFITIKKVKYVLY